MANPTAAPTSAAPTAILIGSAATQSSVKSPAGKFHDTCKVSAISADCSSLGVNGAVAAPLKHFRQSALQLTPTTSGWYRVAVSGFTKKTAWAPYDLEVFVE